MLSVVQFCKYPDNFLISLIISLLTVDTFTFTYYYFTHANVKEKKNLKSIGDSNQGLSKSSRMLLPTEL